MEEGHLPVMVKEVMVALSPLPGSFHVDATLGGGGHAVRILESTSPDGRLLGIDADPLAVARSRDRLAPFGERAIVRQANFEDLGQIAPDAGFAAVHGVLFDLGLSSHQLAEAERGFSFRSEGRLDMRFDPARGRPASDLIADESEESLATIFRTYGEERFANRIARAIVRERSRGPIESAARLASVVQSAVPGPRETRSGGRGRTSGRRRIHPATRVFQALRIAVNRELEVLPRALASALEILRPGGRLVVISYHSLEDRIVKRFIAAERRGCVCPPELPVCVCGRSPRLRPVGARPQQPTPEEIASNPRARSARLRAAERLAA
jgi:16S rRNA (cytosine1402-N4)-methyltransferase